MSYKISVAKSKVITPTYGSILYEGQAYQDSRVKNKPTFPKLKTSAKSVQTSAEVCADYG